MANIKRKHVTEKIVEFIKERQQEKGQFKDFETEEEIRKVAKDLSYYII